MPLDQTEFLHRDDNSRLAYRRTRARDGRTGVVWLGGFKSDMAGGKATSLHSATADAGRGFLRFDYFGHGESDGDFADG
ncbi:MAG: alpha/beta hydrolase, partial [Pseudomonadota bacterium]